MLFINSSAFFSLLILLFISNTSLASRARLLSLQNKNHLLDSELIFSLPTKASELDSFLVLESGQTTSLKSLQAPYASGLIQYGPSSFAVGLGRQDDLSSAQREKFNSLTTEFFELSQNPLSLIWSYKNKGSVYALGTFYSEKKDVLNSESESTQVLRGGYRSGFLTVSAAFQLKSEVVAALNKELSIKNSGSVSVLYEVDNFAISGEAETFSSDQMNTGSHLNQISYQTLQMALSDRTEFDQNQFFYRFDLIIKNLEYKISGLKEHQNQLPLTLGIESRQTEWLILRSSLQQTVFINQAENVPAESNSTQAAFGMGLRFKNLTLDGTLAGLIGPTQTGVIDTNQFLSQVSLTAIF